MSNLADRVKEFEEPGVQLVAARAPSKSHFGGHPTLLGDMRWPEWNGKRFALLARISLAELQSCQRLEWLPSEGALLFVYPGDEQPWGIYPKDKEYSSVLHVPDLNEPAPASEGQFQFSHISFRSIRSLPPFERVGEDENIEDNYLELQDSRFDGLPRHLVGGLPCIYQNDDMGLQAQLAMHQPFTGDARDFKQIKRGAQDWRLLAQFDSDDDMEVAWGDAGCLYFWIRTIDATAGKFDNVWSFLQCP